MSHNLISDRNWQLSNATRSNLNFTIQPGGRAETSFTSVIGSPDDGPNVIPNEIELAMEIVGAQDPYNPTVFARVEITYEYDDHFFSSLCPIVPIEGNRFRTTLYPEQSRFAGMEHNAFQRVSLHLFSSTQVQLNNVSLVVKETDLAHFHVQEGATYHGVRITAEQGITITRSDNFSRVVFNSSEFTVTAGGRRVLFMDYTANPARFIFDGELSARIIVPINEAISNAETRLQTAINVESGRITMAVTEFRNEDAAIRSALSIERGRITAEVTNRQNADNALSSRIDVQAGRINFVVREGGNSSNFTITPRMIQLTTDVVRVTNLDASQITTGTLNASHINTNSLSIAGERINSGTLPAARIGSGAINNARIANGAVGSTKLQDQCVLSAHLSQSLVLPGVLHVRGFNNDNRLNVAQAGVWINGPIRMSGNIRFHDHNAATGRPTAPASLGDVAVISWNPATVQQTIASCVTAINNLRTQVANMRLNMNVGRQRMNQYRDRLRERGFMG